MIATLIKLLEIRIVANSFFGDCSNKLIVCEDFDSSLLSVSLSFGVNEKKATSEPEINAENTNKIIKTIQSL